MFVLKHCTKPCFCPALSQKGPTNLAVSLNLLPLFIPSAPEHPSLEVLFFDARITLSSAHEIQTAFILHTTIIIVNIEPGVLFIEVFNNLEFWLMNNPFSVIC